MCGVQAVGRSCAVECGRQTGEAGRGESEQQWPRPAHPDTSVLCTVNAAGGLVVGEPDGVLAWSRDGCLHASCKKC